MATVSEPGKKPWPIPATINLETSDLTAKGPTPEQLAEIIMTTKPMLEPGSPCDARTTERVEKNRVKKGSSLAAEVREVTDKIRNLTDCQTIKDEIKKQLNSFADANKDTIDQVKKKLGEILPLLKIPSNPFKLPSYIKKSTIGRVLPDLDATIDFIKRATEVIKAVTELANAIKDVEPRLRACKSSIVDDLKQFRDDTIDKVVNELEKQIRDTIRETICGGLNELGVSTGDLADVIDAVKSVSDMKKALDGALTSVQGLMKQYQGDLKGLTGVDPVFNFDSPEQLAESIDTATTIDPNTGISPYDQYKLDVMAVMSKPDPVNTVAPVISGVVEVGAVLTTTNGSWTDGTNPQTYTYTYQWYRSGVPIPEATSQTYELDIEDFDRNIYCVVTASHEVGQEDAQSNTLGPVMMPTAAGNVPTITGTATVGSTLTVSPASITKSWYTRNAPYRQYRWMRVNDMTGKGYVIEEDTETNSAPFTATYIVTSADIGYKIMVSEYVAIGYGSVRLDSGYTSVVPTP